MKGIYIPLSVLFCLFNSTDSIAQESMPRQLNTYADHASGGMTLVAPDIHYVDVPALTLMSVTVVRTSGACEVRVKAGTGFAKGPAEWLPVINNVMGQIGGEVERANVVVLPPSTDAQRVHITFDSVGKGHCGYRSYVKGAHLPTKAAEALAPTLAQLLFEHVAASMLGIDQDSFMSDPLLERGVNAAFAVFQDSTVAGFGATMMMNEIQMRVSRALPNSHGLAVFVTNLMQGATRELYGPYFSAISPTYR